MLSEIEPAAYGMAQWWGCRLSEEACVLEKLWEDALGQASEENQDAVESQRIGEQ